jgi:hypothetical protein
MSGCREIWHGWPRPRTVSFHASFLVVYCTLKTCPCSRRLLSRLVAEPLLKTCKHMDSHQHAKMTACGVICDFWKHIRINLMVWLRVAIYIPRWIRASKRLASGIHIILWCVLSTCLHLQWIPHKGRLIEAAHTARIHGVCSFSLSGGMIQCQRTWGMPRRCRV